MQLSIKNGDFPAKEFPPQPEGYPRKPVSKAGSPQAETIPPVMRQ